jgi:hypothetical protein
MPTPVSSAFPAKGHSGRSSSVTDSFSVFHIDHWIGVLFIIWHKNFHKTMLDDGIRVEEI